MLVLAPPLPTPRRAIDPLSPFKTPTFQNRSLGSANPELLKQRDQSAPEEN